MARDFRVTGLLRTRGLLIEGSHFRYTNPEPTHGEIYLNCRPLIPHVDIMSALARDLVAEVAVAMRNTDPPSAAVSVVMGPAHGGDKIAQYVAAIEVAKLRYISEGPLDYIETEKTTDGNFIVKPGRFYESHLNPDSRVLVVDDVFTSGSSVKKVIALARGHGAEVVAVGGFINRKARLNAASFGIKAFAVLEDYIVPDYPEAGCPFCAEGRPMVTNVGHGHEFRDQFPNYKGRFAEIDLPK